MQAEPSPTYRLSPAGRRLTLVLLAASVVLWLAAVWIMGNTLNIRYLRPPTDNQPCTLWLVVAATFKDAAVPSGIADKLCAPLTTNQLVPSLLLLVLVVAVPLVMWNLCEEWFTRYTITPQGLVYQTIGSIKVLYLWDSIYGIRRVDPEADEPVDELVVDRAGVLQIKNGLLRALHRLAFGRSRVPVYAGVENRDELLARIQQYAELQPAVVGQGVQTARRSL